MSCINDQEEKENDRINRIDRIYDKFAEKD